MTTHELLKQRYQCIAPYPGHNFGKDVQVGDIFISQNENDCPGQMIHLRQNIQRTLTTSFSDSLSAFPANFRSMHWSEGRSVDDMPEYVKCGQHVLKVVRWGNDWIGRFCYVFGQESKYRIDRHDLLPATLAEYEAYQNSKQP